MKYIIILAALVVILAFGLYMFVWNVLIACADEHEEFNRESRERDES